MQFSHLVSRVAEETGLNATADATKIKSWINEAYRFMCGMREWPWLLGSKVVQTTPDITTLTASVAAGGTAVTLSATYTSSLANDYYIQFSATDDWYLITAHTAGTDTLTISPGYTSSDALVAGTCKIRRVHYSLDSDVDRIITMREAIQDRELTYVDPRDMDRQLPDPTATGTPHVYTLLGCDSSNNWRISFYPLPDAKVNIHYRYYKRTTDLSADADIPIIPSKFHMGIAFVALAMFGHAYIDDDRMASAENRARQVVGEMVGQISPIPAKHPVIQPWDSRGGSRSPGAQFPSDFPRYWR